MFGLDKFGGIGLHRIQRFFETHNIDTERLAKRSVVITGTNGKGSTAHLTGAALTAHGLKVGVFTSPHMFDLNERFQLAGAQIDQATFDRLSSTATAFNQSLPEGDKLGAFQFLFLVAILWFEETSPDAMVWEAGIGGRYDPVRMVRARYGAVTSVELEHTEVLGGTEELIAYDKVDAVAPDGTVLLSPLVPADLHERLHVYCSLARRELANIGSLARIEQLSGTANGTGFQLNFSDGTAQDINLAMLGRHQAANAVTADQLARAWLRGAGIAYAPDTSWAALSKVRVPGRLQKISDAPDLWIDVGHTPAAVEGVIKTFQSVAPPDKTLAVLGVSASKNVDAIARLAAHSFDNAILTRAQRSGAPIERLATQFDSANRTYTIAPSVSQAVAQARGRATREGKTILVLGGLFLAAEFQTAWEGGDPNALDFL